MFIGDKKIIISRKPPTTLNPSDKAATATLSSNRLGATHTAANAYQWIRAISSKLTGKYYFEMTITTSPTPEHGAGISLAGSALLTSGWVGDGVNSVGVIHNGNQYEASSPTTIIASTAQGDVISVAVNLDAKLFWARKNNGAWNSVLGTGDPSSNVLGKSFALAGPYVPTMSFYYQNDVMSLNFGNNPYAYSPPSGYKNWT